jgi:hypothetical protein
MIRYVWFKSGYTDVDPRHFSNKIIAIYLHAINKLSFDVVIATKYYFSKDFFINYDTHNIWLIQTSAMFL